jgi:hypothetical protein
MVLDPSVRRAAKPSAPRPEPGASLRSQAFNRLTRRTTHHVGFVLVTQGVEAALSAWDVPARRGLLLDRRRVSVSGVPSRP